MNNEEKILALLGNMDKRFDKMDERFDKMDERLDKMDERFDKMDERMEGFEIGQGVLVKNMSSLIEEVTELRQSQVRMEVKFTEKIDALFDGYELIQDTLTDHTARLERIEEKVENHDIIIQHIRR